MVGCIVAATASSIKILIGGMVLIALGASTQLSFGFVSNELVPMRYRFFCNSWLYLWTLPISGFGPAVSQAFILYTPVGWRGLVTEAPPKQSVAKADFISAATIS